MRIFIMQGDAYDVPLEILTSDGGSATDEHVEEVEVVIGTLRKTFTAGEVTYDAEAAEWLIPLTQEETFSMPDRSHDIQLRVKLRGDGDVIGIDLGEAVVLPSSSKVVL